MPRIKFRIIFFLLCVLQDIYSQTISNINSAFQYGLNFNNASERQFGTTIPKGIEIAFHKQRIGDEYWEKTFNYPQTGWSLSYIDHQNNYLGSTIAFNRYMNYVFVRKKAIETFARLSAGLLYATKIYGHNGHSRENYNNAIGQYLSFSAELGLGVIIYPTARLSVNLAATGSHFSNGAMSQPNDGLNLVMFKLGTGYVIGDRKSTEFKQPDALEDDRSVKCNISSGAGYKQIDNDNEEKFRLFTVSVYADKKVSHVNAFNAGMDIFLNRAVEYTIENNPEHKGKDFRRIGISAGHEFFIGKVGILTQLGYHVYSPYPAFSDYYQKFGLKYYFNDRFFAAVNLRIFKFEVSDEIAWGIGVRL